MAHRVGIIGGDGIGPEVTAEALKVVRAAGVALDTTDYDLGGRRYLATGDVLPDPVLDELRGYDAILLGAVGTPEVPPGVLERGLLLKMRFALDLYVNLRPFKAGPNRHNDGVDFLVVRENTEGTYAGEGGFLRHGTPGSATRGSVEHPPPASNGASGTFGASPGGETDASARMLNAVDKTDDVEGTTSQIGDAIAAAC